MRESKNKKGFTLIELSLSLAFIGILSITIVLIINNTVQAYRRGLTLNEINTVGMELVDDMQAAIQNSPKTINNCNGYNPAECVSFVVKDGSAPEYGGFCTGKYSYVWKRDGRDNDVEVNGRKGFYLAKVKDDGRAICKAYIEDNSRIDFGSGIGVDVEILLTADDSNKLTLYDLEVSGPAIDNAGGTAFYAVSFVLGTVDGGVNVGASGNFCKVPKEYDSNFDYCAINKFNFAVQAGGQNNG